MNRSKPVLASVYLVFMGLMWSGVAVANDEESNKEAVVAFYEMTFQDHKPAEAAQRYIGDEYIQHNPTCLTAPSPLWISSRAFSRRIRKPITRSSGSLPKTTW